MLQLEEMSCGYGPFCAVSGLSIKVTAGSIFALIGANGAGKTSTIMSIAGHVKLQGGAINFNGENIAHLPPQARVRQGIALVPEGRRLFSDLTVRENLVVGGLTLDRFSGRDRMEYIYSLFPRLSEREEQLAGSLSGGEQQMLAIGRALMPNPRLLMIDEVSLGLMPAIVDVCYAAIAGLKNEGMTILLVEQNTQRAIRVADDVCVLESGSMVWSGSGADACSDPTLIEAYLGLI